MNVGQNEISDHPPPPFFLPRKTLYLYYYYRFQVNEMTNAIQAIQNTIIEKVVIY